MLAATSHGTATPFQMESVDYLGGRVRGGKDM